MVSGENTRYHAALHPSHRTYVWLWLVGVSSTMSWWWQVYCYWAFTVFSGQVKYSNWGHVILSWTLSVEWSPFPAVKVGSATIHAKVWLSRILALWRWFKPCWICVPRKASLEPPAGTKVALPSDPCSGRLRRSWMSLHSTSDRTAYDGGGNLWDAISWFDGTDIDTWPLEKFQCGQTLHLWRAGYAAAPHHVYEGQVPGGPLFVDFHQRASKFCWWGAWKATQNKGFLKWWIDPAMDHLQ